MGSSESVPRNIVIDKERGIFDESSEPSLLKKTKFTKQKEKLPGIEYTGNELISEQEFKDLKDYYDERIRNLQQRNAELYGATIENFARAVERAEEKYLNALHPPVCGESQNKLIDCLKANKDKILDCSQLFDDFNLCMQRHRCTRPTPKSR